MLTQVDTFDLYSLVFTENGSYPSPMYETFESLKAEWDVYSGDVFVYTFTKDKKFVSVKKMVLSLASHNKTD